MLQLTALFINLNIHWKHNFKSLTLRTSQTVNPERNNECIESTTIYYFSSSLSGSRQLQYHRGRLVSARRESLRNRCGERTSNGSARSGTDRVPRGADRCQAGGFPHPRPQLGRSSRWLHWPKHHHRKSGKDYRSALLCRGDFRWSRSIVFRFKHILPNRCLLTIHHHLPIPFDAK
jgi:hypothetical protein